MRLDTYFLYSDLEVPYEGMPEVKAGLSKNSSVPSVAGGILWPDVVNKIFYSFGGYFPHATPQPFRTWSYETSHDRWDIVNTSGDTPSYVAHGMGTVASDSGVGYYLGGYHSNQTQRGWSSHVHYTSNLVSFDMVSRKYTNNTGPDSSGRGEGVMLFIPASRSGLLIYFGGVRQDVENGTISGVSIFSFEVI
jgi:hypothetical protein